MGFWLGLELGERFKRVVTCERVREVITLEGSGDLITSLPPSLAS